MTDDLGALGDLGLDFVTSAHRRAGRSRDTVGMVGMAGMG